MDWLPTIFDRCMCCGLRWFIQHARDRFVQCTTSHVGAVYGGPTLSTAPVWCWSMTSVQPWKGDPRAKATSVANTANARRQSITSDRARAFSASCNRFRPGISSVNQDSIIIKLEFSAGGLLLSGDFAV